ncbi:MAG: methyltransferase [Geobacter sp.]|nr:MAG: methyltransferase [Geobacter sp.]
MKMPETLKRLLKKIVTAEQYSRFTSMLAPNVRAKSFKFCRQFLKGKNGFEVGGPSSIFSSAGMMPLYPIVARIDNCNFSHSTTWEGDLAEGLNYHFDLHRPPGFQYIREATDLKGIESDQYDFVLSSHNIEHLANPLCALREWQRIIKPDGLLILVVPHKEGTFDHRRPITPLMHIIDDYEKGRDETDLTHLKEVLDLHDLDRDTGSASYDEFRMRSFSNFENRCIHHHVFNTEAVIDLLDNADFELLMIEPMLPCHIIAIARKTAKGKYFDNAWLKVASAAFRRLSPFVGDRRKSLDSN